MENKRLFVPELGTILSLSKDSVHFVYNKGLKDSQEVKEHFKVKDKE